MNFLMSSLLSDFGKFCPSHSSAVSGLLKALAHVFDSFCCTGSSSSSGSSSSYSSSSAGSFGLSFDFPAGFSSSLLFLRAAFSFRRASISFKILSVPDVGVIDCR